MAKKAKKKASAKPKAKKADSRGVVVMVGTRKGAFFLKSDSTRKAWKTNGPHFLGSIVYHAVLDPRDNKTLLAAVKAGHLGHTIYRSTDWGKTWKESSQPPAFPKAPEGKTGRVVDHVFWLTPGHAS